MSTQPASVADNRREPRHPAACRATARVAISVEIVDASAYGVKARMSLNLPVGATLKIGLPGGIERHSRIAWSRGDHVGCEFLAPLAPGELSVLLNATGIARPRADLFAAAG